LGDIVKDEVNVTQRRADLGRITNVTLKEFECRANSLRLAEVKNPNAVAAFLEPPDEKASEIS
jgi:hypothetical protein